MDQAHREAAGAGQQAGARRSQFVRAALTAVVVLGVLVSGAEGLKCYTNNNNDVTVLPSNVTTTVECSAKQLCAAITVQDPPPYFLRTCGPTQDQPCACMLDCVPMWATDGQGMWSDPQDSTSKGKTHTKVCDSDLCNAEAFCGLVSAGRLASTTPVLGLVAAWSLLVTLAGQRV
uniref:Uncharacterized protein n=1 Tax=Hemiselmis andersenii TaxID=464988 RepID=A0A6U4Q873_HEMAN